jgi:hypothetical protein
MVAEINRDDAGRLAQKLTECKNVLQTGNVFSCLLKFRDILEKMAKTAMIPADEKELHKEITETFWKSMGL